MKTMTRLKRSLTALLLLLVYRINSMSHIIKLGMFRAERKCHVCEKDLTSEKHYRCRRCHNPVCIEHVKFLHGILYCDKCIKIARVEKPR